MNDPGKTDYFGSNYLTYLTPRKGAKGPQGLEDFRVGGKFTLVHAIKNGSTTIQIYGGGAEGGDEFVDMVGKLGLRAYLAPSYRNVILGRKAEEISPWAFPLIEKDRI